MAKNHAVAESTDGTAFLHAFASNAVTGSVYVAISALGENGDVDRVQECYIKMSDALDFADKLRAAAFEALDNLTAKVANGIKEASK